MNRNNLSLENCKNKSIAVALVFSSLLVGAPDVWADNFYSMHAPAEQGTLTNIIAKYNRLDTNAPNDIQRDKIDTEYYQVLCAHLPQEHVSNWIGVVESVDNDTPGKGIQIIVLINTHELSGALGVEFVIGNGYAYGVDAQSTKPHPPTIFPVGSQLYNVASELSTDDIVKFSGNFIPFSSTKACQDNDTSYIAVFHFTSLRKIGHDASIY
ncbi:MAG: hypothetical protein ACRER0_01080 [Gammaproteobacteria bacterium]